MTTAPEEVGGAAPTDLTPGGVLTRRAPATTFEVSLDNFTGPFDLLLLPVGAYQPRWFMRVVHMDPAEALGAYAELAGDGAPALLPIHWGTFKLTDEPMDEPPRVTQQLWQEAGRAGERLWLLRHGETRVLR